MSIIESVKTFIATYSGLTANVPLLVDALGYVPTEYGIISLPGAKIIEQYIDGGSVREFPFAFQSTMSTADELERIENSGFYEDFADWLESQTLAGTLPTMESGKTAEKIEAVGWGYIQEQGDAGTAIYQITCRLVYDQAKP